MTSPPWAIVCAAYTKYIPRIDYHQLLQIYEVWVLRLDNEVLGSIAINFAPDYNALIMNNMVVDPPAQGKGYGRALVAHAEAVARERRFTALRLFTNVHTVENMGMYARMGFVDMGKGLDEGYESVLFRTELV